ncbi:hypothetical protein QUB80_05540 [Chlorogloeopsis sp. ULAP01]|uniref:hypothetical protein n=1 Tax=Chlorogloeopsis sp. ULAP01 TaxID=3056483 RepID=UPI0025AA98A8|nr:hypothetical protein [Chlorogloeopsis sp. ULAP01]MDM9380162.1 hypothetical protein [Chlorogloeopsis sp. ULAP01]
MKIEKPNDQPLSFEDLKNFDKPKALIKRAVADGKLFKQEKDCIDVTIYADRKVTVEELNLCQKIIWDKIQKGELEYSWW